MCRIFSADCFICGFTASQSPLFCEAKYSGLHFAHKPSVLLRVCFQSFSPLYALKNTLKKTFSTCIRLHFPVSFILFYSLFLFLRVHERQIISLSYMDICKPFCGGVLQKFLPLTIIGKLQAVCRGVSRKFYKKIAEKFSRQPQIKRKSDIAQTSFSIFIILSLKIKGYNLLFHKTHNYVYWNTICYSIDNVP